MDTSSQILNQIFGHSQESDDQQQNYQQMIASGGRSQYVELEHFETEEQFQQWLSTQGRKWGIVQKGRVTIEDIIDQYACVFRRRKGYACRVQMRVRHNRRTGLKIVEVLPFPHDHNFYGPAMPNDMMMEDGGVNPQSLVRNFASNFGSTSSFDGHDHQQSEYDQDNDPVGSAFELKQDLDYPALMDQATTNGMDENEHQPQQPMEMLWSNILNNPAIQQFAANGGTGVEGMLENGELAQFVDNQQQQQTMMGDGGGDFGNGGGGEENGGGGGTADDQQLLDQAEALANCVAEKVVSYLALQFEPKFDSIITALGVLTKSIDDLKRSQKQRHSPTKVIQIGKQQQNGVTSQSQAAGRLPTTFPSSSIRTLLPTTFRQPHQKEGDNNQMVATQRNQRQQQKEDSSNTGNSNGLRQQEQQQQKEKQQQQQEHRQKNNLSTARTSSQSHSMSTPSLSNKQNGQSPASSVSNSIISLATNAIANSSAQQSTQFSSLPSLKNGIPVQPQKYPFGSLHKSPLSLSARMPNLTVNKFGMSLSRTVNSPMKTSRKSVHAYRQRRRELSYRYMKEIGMSLTINGVTKSIFIWRPMEIANACQVKRRELAKVGKRVIYRGMDVTNMLYRVDCSRELVNGRRCGQMIADSLWPRGYFQNRMLMPILKGVSHRAKKRVDGSARRPVAHDQFEIFKVALLLLGGFLMDEMERSKWMETAREGVNQRGLDELANSKRAHYEYEGGPLFANADAVEEDEFIEDEEEEEEEDGEMDGIGADGNDMEGQSRKQSAYSNLQQQNMNSHKNYGPEEYMAEHPPTLYQGDEEDDEEEQYQDDEGERRNGD